MVRYSIKRRIINLSEAFRKDGYKIKKIVTEFNKIGIAAEHKTAVNYDTGEKKRAYYLEGTGYQMGYLLGMLAEKEISLMTGKFADNVIPSFIGIRDEKKRGLVEDLLMSVLYKVSKSTYSELPPEIRNEIQGIYDGCIKYNPKTRVDMQRLFVLNAGIDALCSMVYTGFFFSKRAYRLYPHGFKLPMYCNAFSVFGKSAGGGHYFGRDFMFPTADVFQDTAAHIIYNPDPESGLKPFPFISVTAPGMAGSISAMNIRGVGAGVDMSPAGNCNPKKVGTNSLLLNRMCIQYGSSVKRAVDIIEKTQRGVSWNYIIADGRNDRACVVEAGDSNDIPDFTRFPAKEYLNLLPDNEYLREHPSAQFRNGLMVRWNDYNYPSEYLKFNSSLWNEYNKKNFFKKKLYEDAFGRIGYINKSPDEKNCPSTYYFAPQREKSHEIVITTNHYIIPEMRLYAMHPWTALIVGDKINDIQWRYDELNNQILKTVEEKGFIDFKEAKRIVEFLAPYGKHPSYYSTNPKSSDGKEVRIEGCSSVFDLKNKTVESHFGYYCDEWIKTKLSNYFS